jgi:hypothetical protein
MGKPVFGARPIAGYVETLRQVLDHAGVLSGTAARTIARRKLATAAYLRRAS